ncbi:hypothetical protein [Pedobacter panaciterrae]|uniref:hypothetical protein n=1 Tax=Pedobacter panaciterrae TaxID=363849 RepID=UPI002599F8A8|nr:hypothetical protein [uncultured Pedobacter sp.]
MDQLKAVGVGGWAYKKRDRYGSILGKFGYWKNNGSFTGPGRKKLRKLAEKATDNRIKKLFVQVDALMERFIAHFS